MAALHTDTSVLGKEAANFERIAGELKSVLARVESTAAELDGHWQGNAAKAAQAAIRRFHEAANAHVQQLNNISTNIHTASARYGATDGEQAAALTSAMGGGMGGPTTGTSAAATPPAAQGAQVHPAAAAGNGQHNATAPGVWRHSSDTPRTVQFVDFKQDGPAAPAPTPAPAPPVTGDPIKLPPRTTPPPPTVITAAPPDDGRKHGPGFPNCPPEEVAQHGLEVLGGAAAAAAGVAGEAPTLGAATFGILAGAAGVTTGIEGLEECK